MAHELAGALQQASWIRQRRTVKEPYVYVRSEYIDVAEGSIAQTCNRMAVVQKVRGLRPRICALPQTSDVQWLPIHLRALSSTHRWRDPVRERH